MHFQARPVPNSLHSQPAESSDIIKPASATLGKRCRAFWRIFDWWGKEAKGAGCEGHSRYSIWKGFRPKVKTAGPGIWIGCRSQYSRPNMEACHCYTNIKSLERSAWSIIIPTNINDLRSGQVNGKANQQPINLVSWKTPSTQFRGGGKVLALGSIVPLPLAGYGPGDKSIECN